MEFYEKKYKEALGRAKECHTDGLSLHQPVKDVLEHIFPELKESEDERIRKEIVNFICWATDRGSITSEQREKSNSWLAWLEKKRYSEFELENEYWRGYDDGKKQDDKGLQ